MSRLMARPTWGPLRRHAIVLAALALMLLAPSTAAAARSEFFGIVQGPSLDSRDLTGMAGSPDPTGMVGARIRASRFLLNWEWVQPVAGPPRWGATDRLIGQLAFRGIRVLPSVWGNPDWVFGGEARPPLERSQDIQAWQNFLKALVARYGQGGSYWATAYRQQYGASATPLPIQAWQIWNEPNLKKFYLPYPAPKHYARLVKISHGAIRSEDPQARIVLAGMPGYGDVKAWDFLNEFYSVAGIKNYFDAAALHPYAADVAHVRLEIQKVREVMVNRADRATPLWLTELAWGSDPPDQFGINKGLAGQQQMLRDSYKMILQNRTAWN
ncbi:MAG: glycosyl hydrolase, partial [Actinomycetota bacterium]